MQLILHAVGIEVAIQLPLVSHPFLLLNSVAVEQINFDIEFFFL